MAREKKQSVENIVLDEQALTAPVEKVPITKEPTEEKSNKTIYRVSEGSSNLINCLRNEKIIVKFIARAKGNITDPDHILYGGMAKGAKMNVTTPLLKNGGYANVLTRDEKNYLEYALGLEPNALSVYNKHNNFWDDSNEDGLGTIELVKGDNYFDLSKPIDYIKYKVLLNNEDIIAPSIQALQDRPKATYKFVIIKENETTKDANKRVTLKARAYMEFGKINNDADKLRAIIETVEGRVVASNTKIELLQARVGDILEANTKLFLQVVGDPLLDNKILIRKAIEKGVIVNRGNYLYYKLNSAPLCDNGQEPTLSIAANYLNLPKNQELKFTIEAQIKD